MKSKILFLFLLPSICFSQQMIKGKITCETPEISGILVVNLSNENETKTDDFGKFTIKAKTGDLLVISAPHIYKKRHIVEENDFNKEINIETESRAIVIETVEINSYSHINAENLGIVPKGQKKYTHAERKLRRATNWSPELGAGTMIGVGFSFDPVINALSGRTKVLKNLVEMEREDKRIAYLSSLFDEDFFTQILQIPTYNITEFKFYALYHLEKDVSKKERDTFIRKFSREELELKLISLAETYLKLKNGK